MKKSTGAVGGGQKSLLSFFTKAPTPTPVAAVPSSVVSKQTPVASTPTPIVVKPSLIDNVMIDCGKNDGKNDGGIDEMDVDEMVVKKRGLISIFSIFMV